jgi:hypothetical protein
VFLQVFFWRGGSAILLGDMTIFAGFDVVN